MKKIESQIALLTTAIEKLVNNPEAPVYNDYVLPAEANRVAAVDSTIQGDTVIAQLKAMSNAEFDAWWAANVTNANQAIGVLKRLARVVIRKL